MLQFQKYAIKHFRFLSNYGYEPIQDNNDNQQSFCGQNNRVDVMFEPFGYELTCQFVNNEGNTFSLQDGLTYENIEEFKGLYQIGNESDIEKGILYLARAVKKLIIKIDLSNQNNFQRIYQYQIEMQKKLLEQYYVETDLKKAEAFWDEKKYDDAQVLFEKHINNLSKSQLKKVDYIKNHNHLSK